MKFVIDHDLHIHSCLSSCSKIPEQTAEAFLAYARKNGLKRLAVTDHFWDERVPGASDWYKPQNFAHISEILPLPQCEGVKLHFGCETDMDKFFTVGISKERLEEFDFIIIPTNHLHMDGFTVSASDNTVAARARVFMEKNHALLDKELPFDKIGLAHFTCCLMNKHSDGTRDEIIDLISDSEYAEFFERAAEKGIGIELNMFLSEIASESVIRPYRIAKACGCKFYLGSDSHRPSELDGAMARFEAIVDALRLTEDDKFIPSSMK
jgi:histidinol phosphatase-like PHP family hydrolase